MKVVYQTRRGHTRKLASRIREWLVGQSFDADLIDVSLGPGWHDWSGVNGVIVVAPIYEGSFPVELIEFVERHSSSLNQLPGAFVPSSLNVVALGESEVHDTRNAIVKFVETTGWQPTVCIPVAGSIMSIDSEWTRRALASSLVPPANELDDYTDWDALERAVTEFVRSHVSPTVD